MKIRVATEADIPEMHRIRLSVRENRLLDPHLIQPKDYRLMLVDRGRGWVAESDGQVSGFAIVDCVRRNIWALFVDPALEGRGAGRALHDTMLDWLFSGGVERVWLGTDPGTRAERFYRSAGWMYVNTRHGEAIYEMSGGDWLTRSADRPLPNRWLDL
jgi:GNAT superfamily N-acetyltransferase